MARAHARARAQGSWSRDQRPDPRRSSAVVATDCFARARVQWDRDTRQEARVMSQRERERDWQPESRSLH